MPVLTTGAWAWTAFMMPIPPDIELTVRRGRDALRDCQGIPAALHLLGPPVGDATRS
jgi:hypothetical protein